MGNNIAEHSKNGGNTMKKYSILALALVLCVTGLTGCRRKMDVADGTIPTTAATTESTTHPTTMPTTMPATTPTTVPATTETGSSTGTDATNDNMTDDTTANGRSRSHSQMPGVG